MGETQNNLGNLLIFLQNKRRKKDNLEKAIACYENFKSIYF
jgi:Fic family protein